MDYHHAFHMDDLLYGADTLEKIQDTVRKLSEILEKAKFPLTKWASNDPEVRRDLDESERIESYIKLEKSEDSVRILGLHYLSLMGIVFVTKSTYEKIGDGWGG